MPTVIVSIRERCRWKAGKSRTLSLRHVWAGILFSTCRLSDRFISQPTRLEGDHAFVHRSWGLSTIFPNGICNFPYFASFINCLSCQLCAQLKTTLNYVFRSQFSVFGLPEKFLRGNRRTRKPERSARNGKKNYSKWQNDSIALFFILSAARS